MQDNGGLRDGKVRLGAENPDRAYTSLPLAARIYSADGTLPPDQVSRVPPASPRETFGLCATVISTPFPNLALGPGGGGAWLAP